MGKIVQKNTPPTYIDFDGIEQDLTEEVRGQWRESKLNRHMDRDPTPHDWVTTADGLEEICSTCYLRRPRFVQCHRCQKMVLHLTQVRMVGASEWSWVGCDDCWESEMAPVVGAIENLSWNTRKDLMKIIDRMADLEKKAGAK